MRPTWITAFLDVPSSHRAASQRFWAAVTGSTLSPARGADGEFATFLPPDGDPYLRSQVIGNGLCILVEFEPVGECRIFRHDGESLPGWRRQLAGEV